MKDLVLYTGGRRRNLEDLKHLKDMFTEVLAAIGNSIVNNQGAAPCVIVSGCNASIGATTTDISAGWLFWNNEFFRFDGATGLANGLPVWIQTQLDYVGPQVPHADSTLKDSYADITVEMYAAASASDPSHFDYSSTEGVSQMIRDLIEFNPSDYLPSAHESWHEVNAVGEPAFENSFANASGSNKLRFIRSQDATVQVSGRITFGGAAGNIFTLPFGFRPSNDIFTTCRVRDTTDSTYSMEDLTIYTNGQVGFQNVEQNLPSSGTVYIHIHVVFKAL